MAASEYEPHVPSSPSYEPSEDYGVGGTPQHHSTMEFEPPPNSDETRITQSQTQSQSRAERLLALRAPLIERGKRVPALEASIEKHETEANCLYDLLQTARYGEKIMADRLDEAMRAVDLERIETDSVRDRLRLAEVQLAESRDLLHVKETVHTEEVAKLEEKCVNMKRKIELLKTGQRKDYDQRIKELERISTEYQTDLLHRTQERDQWRESAIASEEHLKVLKAKKTKIQSLSALLHTERTLSASLKKQLEEARKAAKNAEQQKSKQNARDSEKAAREKALETEKAKSTELRQKLKDADANTRKTQRETSKLKRKCEDLEKQLKHALERAVQAEERAADLEIRPATRSRGLASPRGDMLMSPAPLQMPRRPAEDMASESRSRFTATLPLRLQEEGSLHDNDSEGFSGSPSKVNVTPRSKRKNIKPHKLAPPKRPASDRGTDDHASTREPDTKKRRRTAPAKDVNDPSPESDKTFTGPATSEEPAVASLTPRRKHGKATRKTTASSPAKKKQEEKLGDTGSTDAPRRTLRSRRPISYNYDEQGRDLVNVQDGIEVDFDALRPVPVRQTRETRSSKSKKPNAVSVVSDQHAPRTRLDSPVGVKKSRRGQTIRKQVPVSRSRAR